MKITLPEGFMPPKNARSDEPFEVVATLRPSEDGTFSIVAVDGLKLSEEDEMEEVDERTDASAIRLPYEEDDE
jgi:hypothetical protein